MDIKKLLESGEEVKGVVMSAVKNEDLACVVLNVNCGGQTVIIPYDEIDVNLNTYNSPSPGMLARYIGETVMVQIIADEPVLGTIKPFKERQRTDVIEKLEKEPIEAVITGFAKFGAYVSIKGSVSAILKNQDFSDDYVEVSAVHKVGDKIPVVLATYNASKKITVKPVNKFKIEKFDIKNIHEGDVLSGKIKSIKPIGCFVSIAPGLDGLTSIPTVGDDEFSVGDEVVYVIKKINEEDRKVKVTILKKIEPGYDVE